MMTGIYTSFYTGTLKYLQPISPFRYGLGNHPTFLLIEGPRHLSSRNKWDLKSLPSPPPLPKHGSWNLNTTSTPGHWYQVPPTHRTEIFPSPTHPLMYLWYIPYPYMNTCTEISLPIQPIGPGISPPHPTHVGFRNYSLLTVGLWNFQSQPSSKYGPLYLPPSPIMPGSWQITISKPHPYTCTHEYPTPTKHGPCDILQYPHKKMAIGISLHLNSIPKQWLWITLPH